MKTRLIILSFIALVISFHALAAHGAGEPPRYRQAREQARENARNERAIDRHERIDNRYDHNRSYPVRGHVATALPRGYVSVRYRNAPYYFHRGAWYRPYGPRYIVVRPPIGVGIALLPPFYTTVWFGGVPYYYADDTYYLWRPERREYVVTQPPAGAGEVRDEAGGGDELFVYPKNGQSEERQTTDRDECHAWAAAKTGFDPARPPGNLEESAVNSRRADYRRAQGACLEARGYSVK